MTQNNELDLEKKQSLLEDSITPEEEEDNVEYIKPNVEIKLSKEKRQACREIVRELKHLGINQRQLLYLIQLLVLEIENVDVMRKMIAVIGENREEIPVDDEKKKSVVSSSATKKTLIL